MKLTLREFAEENSYEIKDERELGQEYDECLDSEGPVKVGGLTFYPSRILEEIDPIAYRCGFNDWLDYEEWDEFEGDYMKRDDIEKVTEDYEEYLEELEEKEKEE